MSLKNSSFKGGLHMPILSANTKLNIGTKLVNGLESLTSLWDSKLKCNVFKMWRKNTSTVYSFFSDVNNFYVARQNWWMVYVNQALID